MKLSTLKRIVGDKFFSVEFVKKTTGEIRRMTCRFGVTKYLHGGDDPNGKIYVGAR